MTRFKVIAGLLTAVFINSAALPAAAATCDIKSVVQEWTRKKKALANIRMALKDLTTRLVTEGGPTQDYSDSEFGGAPAKESFAKRVKERQGEFSNTILLLAGRTTTCYVCPIKRLYPIVFEAGKMCSDLIKKVNDRGGDFKKTTFNCENVEAFSRYDLQKAALGPEFWDRVKRRQLNLGESLRDQPDTYEGNAVVWDDIKRLAQELEPFATGHDADPDRPQFVAEVRDTGCPGYEQYVAGLEPW